jgi:UDP-N-acetylmuramate--alanine ligase
MDAPTLIGPKTVDSDVCLALDLRQPQRAHLIGVAGSGMRALAEVLAGWGWQLSGSDSNAVAVRDLAAKNIRVFEGHAAEHLPPETQLVIYSDAVPAENPELCRAAELGVPAVSYFQLLGRLSADCHTVAIAGTHGKSSTTAMAAHILVAAGRDPTVFCGATPLGATSGGRAGHSGLMLVEACEYRANFRYLRPQHAAILGIEPDHFDCYDSLEQIEHAFRQFAASVPPEGLLLVRHDCVSTRRATAGLGCRIESFGLCPEADWSAHRLCDERGQFRFEIHYHGRPMCHLRLRTPGRHNVLNALAAAALAWHNHATADQIASGLGGFAGLHRRLEVLGTWRGVTLLDDYAHHPTEVTATLDTIRRMFPHRRVWCVFQPHQASRTARLLDELAASLQNADRVLVAEIFRAREGSPRPGEITAANLARQAGALGVEVLPGHTAKEIVGTLETRLAPGDVLVTLGAGDVEQFRPPHGAGRPVVSVGKRGSLNAETRLDSGNLTMRKP